MMFILHFNVHQITIVLYCIVLYYQDKILKNETHGQYIIGQF